MPASETPDYKATINLPKTDFPMKAQLPIKEPEQISRWEQNKLYHKILESNADKKSFVMPDGPPYANGHIHVGHVLNKVLKDIVVKYRNMAGYHAPFIPGWDCHGLPIELNVTKKLGSKTKELSPKEFRDLCRKEALKWVNLQKSEFIRLGILADWENPYLTMQPEYEADEVRVLADCLDNGVFERGEKPVYWCCALQTALAAAEVEYQDHKSPSIYVKFNVSSKTELIRLEKIVGPIDKPVSFVIWTTTPWTLPANLAISLHPDFTYGFYESGDEILVIAEGLKEAVEAVVDQPLKPIYNTEGRSLEGIQTRHPFMERDAQIVLGNHVTLEAGTGCVHTAPAHGLDDYHVGLKYKLKVCSVVDGGGKYTAEVPQYEGQHIWKVNPLIVEQLKTSGHLLHHTEITHSYPHNPRSKSPLIFRATPQWFIKMDQESHPIRQMALKAVESEIKFFPSWGKQRLKSMVENGPDWCLSRQRTWGVPIPVYICSSCDEVLLDSEIMRKIAQLMEDSKQGIEAYYSNDPREVLAGKACKKCDSLDFVHSPDILDVWFDSGISHTAVQKRRDGLKFPADVYLEGSDQHRGWFQTSLNSSYAAYGKAPYKALITHGFVNDSQGYKMSKSRGNVVDPAKIINKYGAEILRLWVAYEDYGQDVAVSDEMIKRVTETYRRFRNSSRFMIGNLADFNYETDAVAVDQLLPLDQWTLARLNEVIENCTQAYESYDFYKIYHHLNVFYTVDLSAIYLDILKDRLYTWKTDGLARRGAQTVIHECLTQLTRLMAPILSFLAEEVYGYLNIKDKKSSVFFESFPKPKPEWNQPELLKEFEALFAVRSSVLKELESLRRAGTIKSNLDAKVKIKPDNATYQLLNKYSSHLRELLIVSAVNIEEPSDRTEIEIEVSAAEGEKCIRCWHYDLKVGNVEAWPSLCPKCVEALSS